MKSLDCNYFNGSLFHCDTIDVINLRHHVTDTTHYFKGWLSECIYSHIFQSSCVMQELSRYDKSVQTS